MWDLLNSFEHTAFRLEVRDRYDESDEAGSLAKFLAGEPDDLPWMQEWLDLVREAREGGRSFSRVRVVTVPLTDYSRFGLWCAQFTNEAGEDIRYLARDQADVAGVPKHDYWLFDSTTLVRMDFDDADGFLGTELITDPSQVVKHNYWRDAAWHHAVRRDDFAGQQHRGRD
ncbi:DUF6879 family protein [Kribbella italica]|uniref:DUF6879 domain-containing protein n=1 Tax=Kribbella italica TaxID=1540520 RepID=A0A7W9MX14_9ACTN|nr:DUF6879 family protein [Kribbella italica]MBB5839626.1 hypothetical protein [Kribbella italica]